MIESHRVTVDPRGKVFFWWTVVTVLACSCNLLTVVILVFEDIALHWYTEWLFTNALCDIVYLLDMFVQMIARMLFFYI